MRDFVEAADAAIPNLRGIKFTNYALDDFQLTSKPERCRSSPHSALHALDVSVAVFVSVPLDCFRSLYPYGGPRGACISLLSLMFLILLFIQVRTRSPAPLLCRGARGLPPT